MVCIYYIYIYIQSLHPFCYDLIDLMEKMLTLDESKRITLEEIVTHPWLKIYFPEENTPKMSSKASQSQKCKEHKDKDDHKDENNQNVTDNEIHTCTDTDYMSDNNQIKKPKSNHMELLKSPGCMQKHQIPMPKSPSFTHSPYSISNTELSASYSTLNHGGAALNIMIPQQAVSISHSVSRNSSIASPGHHPYPGPQTRTNRVKSKSRTGTNTGYHSPVTLPTSPNSVPRRASTSYGYRSPKRRSIGFKSPKSTSNTNHRPSSPNMLPKTPTPIIESHTSKHDCKQFFAQVVDSEENLHKLRFGKDHKMSNKGNYEAPITTQNGNGNGNGSDSGQEQDNRKDKNKKKNLKKFSKLSSLFTFGSSKKK